MHRNADLYFKKFDYDPEKILAERNMQQHGEVQKYIDNSVLKYCDQFIPKDRGFLKQSGITNTNVGSGEVKWRTPYARKLYYAPASYQFQGAPMRGSYWFDRMKAQYRNDILAGAARVAGAKT